MTKETSSERALIVGGTSGMGLAVARKLLQRGTTVTIVGRNEEKLAGAVADLGALGTVEGKRSDLRDASDVSALIEHVRDAQSPYTALVNAAGTFLPKPFLDHTEADYDAYHDVNRSTFLVTQAIARRMRDHGGGAIVNIGSMWARQAVKATPSSAYSRKPALSEMGLPAASNEMLPVQLSDSSQPMYMSLNVLPK